LKNIPTIATIPAKFSRRWWLIFVAYFVIILAFLLLTENLLDIGFTGTSFLARVILAIISAFIVCLGGFLGGRFYFLICSLGLLIGIIYMLYVVIANTAPGWGDLTSMVGYLFCLAISIVIGLLTELVLLSLRRKKK